MATRERPADRGRRRARESLARTAADFRAARISAGLSLRHVAAAVGVSHTQVRRFEHGSLEDPSIMFLGAACAVVGLELAARAYPAEGGLRDRAQLALLGRLRERLHPSLSWRTEVPLPIPGDLRAWDAEIRGTDWMSRVEAETAIRDRQALDRRVMLKLRDDGPCHLLLLVSDSRTNRAALPLVREALGAVAPLPARAMLAALAAGRNPGGGSVVML
jgi:transcriptional regulator with XRE-family HTH domain